ncbi:MAG: 23S rRNA (adenine(2503)-C(2))-methyltransferase RlmN [Spirochaetota bacterium]
MHIIKNYSLPEMEEYFHSRGLERYRARQLFIWLYSRNAERFDEITTFSKKLRQELSDSFVLSPLTLEERRVSQVDRCEKFLFKTGDGHYIESVLLKNEYEDDGRLTICLSSQVGCQMGCTFCQTARIGFKRNLEPGEILDQISQIRRITGLVNNNIVFMGMGEPFMNYNNVIKAAQIMNYDFGFHISVRKITISTCGILPRIRQYIDEGHLFNLAFSLNDTDPDKRRRYMPVEKIYPSGEILRLFSQKMPKTHNYLTVEYVMRHDNISVENARRLKELFGGARVKINVIPLHPGAHSLDAPDQGAVDRFLSRLEQLDIPVTVRRSLATDINGACGQLSGKKYSPVPESCA